MSYLRHAKQTDSNQTDIVDGLREAGCTVSIIGRPVDLLVGFRGLNHLMEIKLPLGPQGGDPSVRTPEQVTFFREWKGKVHEVRSLDHALQIVGIEKS